MDFTTMMLVLFLAMTLVIYNKVCDKIDNKTVEEF